MWYFYVECRFVESIYFNADFEFLFLQRNLLGYTDSLWYSSIVEISDCQEGKRSPSELPICKENICSKQAYRYSSIVPEWGTPPWIGYAKSEPQELWKVCVFLQRNAIVTSNSLLDFASRQEKELENGAWTKVSLWQLFLCKPDPAQVNHRSETQHGKKVVEITYFFSQGKE